MLMPHEQHIIPVPVIRLGHVADHGHVRAADGLVSLVQVHAQPTLARGDHGLRLERYGTNLHRDPFARGSSDANHSGGVFRSQLEFHCQHEGCIGRQFCNPLLPEHEQVVTAIDSRNEESGGLPQIGGASLPGIGELIQRRLPILRVVREPSNKSVVRLRKVKL